MLQQQDTAMTTQAVMNAKLYSAMAEHIMRPMGLNHAQPVALDIIALAEETEQNAPHAGRPLAQPRPAPPLAT
jgi:hypothetical protein